MTFSPISTMALFLSIIVSTFWKARIYIFNMKLAIVSLIAMMASSATAFAPSAAFTRGVATQLYSDPEDDEEGLDLNLEEMFDM